MRRSTHAVFTAMSLLLANLAFAQQVPVTFTLDPTQSQVDLEVAAGGDMDSDSTAISGTLEALLDVDTMFGSPNITGLQFTGGRIFGDDEMQFNLQVLIVQASVTATDFAGVITTPSPPATVSPHATEANTFEFDAADHEITFDQGILSVDAGFLGTTEFDLSTDPASGQAPPGTLGMIALTEGSSSGGMTQYDAAFSLPLDIMADFDVDAGITTVTVNVHATGQGIANGSFMLEMGGGGDPLPGDFSGNNSVEQADLDLVLLSWGLPGDPIPPGWDSPPNGNVDQDELDAVLLNWGASAGSVVNATQGVPEPTSTLLLCAAFALLFIRGGKCRRK